MKNLLLTALVLVALWQEWRLDQLQKHLDIANDGTAEFSVNIWAETERLEKDALSRDKDQLSLINSLANNVNYFQRDFYLTITTPYNMREAAEEWYYFKKVSKEWPIAREALDENKRKANESCEPGYPLER